MATGDGQDRYVLHTKSIARVIICIVDLHKLLKRLKICMHYSPDQLDLSNCICVFSARDIYITVWVEVFTQYILTCAIFNIPTRC